MAAQVSFEQLRSRAQQLIQKSEFAKEADLLSRQLLRSFRLEATQVSQDDLPLGASRIGGLPDLPADWHWPDWTAYAQQGVQPPKSPAPLSLIAQINLQELPQPLDELPECGVLYFFYDADRQTWGFDPRDRGSFRVLYYPGEIGRLVRATSPGEIAEDRVFDACRIEFTPEMTLPDRPDGLEFTVDEWEAYSELCEDLIDSSGTTNHRLVGHPQIVQNDMRLECQLVSHGIYCGGDRPDFDVPLTESLEAGAAEWMLLLQIDTDEDNPGWMWGDCGRIYYSIRRPELAARRFDQTWLSLQCY